MMFKDDKYCCDCTVCKFLELLPSDHYLCVPPPPPCEQQRPDEEGFCDGICPDSGDLCVKVPGKNKCTCGPDCEDLHPDKETGLCNGVCPFSEDVCANVGGVCTCEISCEYNERTDSCIGKCPFSGEACVKTGDKECTCEPKCEFDDPQGGCRGFCPNPGQACVESSDGCFCSNECEELEPDPVAGLCSGECPITSQVCANVGGRCTCELDCKSRTPDPVTGLCDASCPKSGEACVNNRGKCICGPDCEKTTPDNEGFCPGLCPNTGEAVCVDDGDGGCTCSNCEASEPDENDNCSGDCPIEGQSCIESNGQCTCGIRPPCDIEVDKKCVIPRPPNPTGGECAGKVTRLTLIWTGDTTVQVSGQVMDKTVVEPGGTVTLIGPFDGNDQILNFQSLGGGISGSSEFHMSCSDPDMNGPEDCGKLQGDGKNSKGGSGLANVWILAGLVSGSGGAFDCNINVEPEGGQDNCVLSPINPPSCDTVKKPDTITFLFNGGANPAAQCQSSTITQVTNAKGKTHKDFRCSGQVDPDSPVQVQVDGSTGVVNPGQTFTVGLKSIKETTLSNGGGVQNMEFHVSCSQPFVAGTTAGALTIVGIGGQTISNEVTNNGSTSARVTSVVDDQIGDILDSPFDLGPGESQTIRATDRINVASTGSVTNVVEVTAIGEGSTEECTATDSVTVTVGGGGFGFNF